MTEKKLTKGRTLSIRGKYIHVLANGETTTCYLKNNLLRGITDQKNYIAIGDLVHFNEIGQIVEILERKTFLERKDPLNHRKRHILGANLDRVYITFAIRSPDIDISMLDRYIMAARKGGLTPVIVINKIDLLEDKSIIHELGRIYKNLGIEIYPISTYTKEGTKELIDSLKGHISMLSGPTGAGKTSLINLITGKDLRVGEISAKIQKGKHTTTYSSLIPLADDTFIIDTPGIASFNLFKPEQLDILNYFSDLNEPLGACKFRMCSHTHEPKCMVKEAHEQDLISPMRLTSYHTIIEE